MLMYNCILYLLFTKQINPRPHLRSETHAMHVSGNMDLDLNYLYLLPQQVLETVFRLFLTDIFGSAYNLIEDELFFIIHADDAQFQPANSVAGYYYTHIQVMQELWEEELTVSYTIGARLHRQTVTYPSSLLWIRTIRLGIPAALVEIHVPDFYDWHLPHCLTHQGWTEYTDIVRQYCTHLEILEVRGYFTRNSLRLYDSDDFTMPM